MAAANRYSRTSWFQALEPVHYNFIGNFQRRETIADVFRQPQAGGYKGRNAAGRPTHCRQRLFPPLNKGGCASGWEKCCFATAVGGGGRNRVVRGNGRIDARCLGRRAPAVRVRAHTAFGNWRGRRAWPSVRAVPEGLRESVRLSVAGRGQRAGPAGTRGSAGPGHVVPRRPAPGISAPGPPRLPLAQRRRVAGPRRLCPGPRSRCRAKRLR